MVGLKRAKLKESVNENSNMIIGGKKTMTSSDDSIAIGMTRMKT